MTKCKACGKEYEVNPAYSAMIANLQRQYGDVIGHHFESCIDCLKEDDEYLKYCSKFFSRTGFDICIY